MIDYGHLYAEKKIEIISKELKNVYARSAKEMNTKLSDYLKAFEKKDAKNAKLVKDGKLSKQQYKQWRYNHFLQVKRWNQLHNELAKDMTNTNKIAVSTVNGHIPDVYATNYNYGTYQIESGAEVNTSFTLYDRQTVERITRDNPELLPSLPSEKVLDIPKDLRWNKRIINSEIRQGILQGESIDKIARRMINVASMNNVQAVRSARTMITSAQNGGRIDSYKRAEGMGIKLKKQWVATLDGRTRHSHRRLDGQTADIDEPFTSDSGDIMFPGDTDADPSEVYNCRCTLVSLCEGMDENISSDVITRNTKLGGVSYEDWKRGK